SRDCDRPRERKTLLILGYGAPLSGEGATPGSARGLAVGRSDPLGSCASSCSDILGVMSHIVTDRQKTGSRSAGAEGTGMPYVIKAAIRDPAATTFEFVDQKTMYGGKSIAVGD